MKIKFTYQLDDKSQQGWADFWSKCQHTHPQQHHSFARVEESKGRIALYATGVVDEEIVCTAVFSIRPLFIGKKYSLEAVSLRGPMFDDARYLGEFLRHTIDHFKMLKVGRVRISPHWAFPEAETVQEVLNGVGFSPCYAKSKGLETTGVVDLTRSEDEILGSFSRKIRKNIRVAIEQEVKIRVADDKWQGGQFLAGLNKMLVSRRLTPVSAGEFEGVADHVIKNPSLGVILNAYKGPTHLGSNYVAMCPESAHGLRFFIESEKLRHIKHLTLAPYLWWQGMKWAKKCGCRWFDLEGYDVTDDRDNRLYNIYKQKAGFSPELVTRLGEYQFVCNRLTYELYGQYYNFFRALKYVRSWPSRIQMQHVLSH